MVEVRRLGLADPEPEFLIVGADIHGRLARHPAGHPETLALLADHRARQADRLVALLGVDPDIAAFERLDALRRRIELGDELRRRRRFADVAGLVRRIYGRAPRGRAAKQQEGAESEVRK